MVSQSHFFLVWAFIAWISDKYSFEKRKWAIMFFVFCATITMLGVHIGFLKIYHRSYLISGWIPKLLKVINIT